MSFGELPANWSVGLDGLFTSVTWFKKEVNEFLGMEPLPRRFQRPMWCKSKGLLAPELVMILSGARTAWVSELLATGKPLACNNPKRVKKVL